MRQISKYFTLDLTASKTAEIVALTRLSVSRIFVKIRNRIAEEAERASPFGGMVEVDESYFGAKRVRSKRGRGASGKTIVFGVFKRKGAQFTRKSRRTAKLGLYKRSFAVTNRQQNLFRLVLKLLENNPL